MRKNNIKVNSKQTGTEDRKQVTRNGEETIRGSAKNKLANTSSKLWQLPNQTNLYEIIYIMKTFASLKLQHLLKVDKRKLITLIISQNTDEYERMQNEGINPSTCIENSFQIQMDTY